MDQKQTPQQWCREAVSYVRFKPDRAAVQRELEAHLEDSRALLRSQGVDWMESERLAVEAMGDPKTVGLALDRAHSPWLGWLWQVSRWACGLLTVLALLSVLRSDWRQTLREDLDHLLGPSAMDQVDVLCPEAAAEDFPYTLEDLPECPGPVKAGHYTLTTERALYWNTRTGKGLLALCLTARTWRFWLEEPQLWDTLTAVDSRGTVYTTGSAPRISPSLLSSTPGESRFCIILEPVDPRPEWVELRCDKGGWSLRLILEEAP